MQWLKRRTPTKHGNGREQLPLIMAVPQSSRAVIEPCSTPASPASQAQFPWTCGSQITACQMIPRKNIRISSAVPADALWNAVRSRTLFNNAVPPTASIPSRGSKRPVLIKHKWIKVQVESLHPEQVVCCVLCCVFPPLLVPFLQNVLPPYSCVYHSLLLCSHFALNRSENKWERVRDHFL